MFPTPTKMTDSKTRALATSHLFVVFLKVATTLKELELSYWKKGNIYTRRSFDTHVRILDRYLDTNKYESVTLQRSGLYRFLEASHKTEVKGVNYDNYKCE
jgi:hypothetical protein